MAMIPGRKDPSLVGAGVKPKGILDPNTFWGGAKAAAAAPLMPKIPHPAAAAPPPAPNPPTNYDAMFRASIDAQRGQIDSQLRSAMDAIAQREAAANALVARQPGEVNANYDQAQPALDALKKTTQDVQGQLNIKSLDDPNAAMNPIVAAVAGDRAARLSDQPYLQAGTSELFTRQKGALDQAAMQAKSDLEGRMTDYLQQNALQDRQDKAAEDTFYAHTLFQHDLQKQDAADEAAAKRKEENRMLDASEPPPGTPDWWKWNMQRHPNQSKAFTSGAGGAYANAQRLLTQGEFRGPSAGSEFYYGENAGLKPKRTKLSLQEVLRRYSAPKYAKLRAALRYQYGR